MIIKEGKNSLEEISSKENNYDDKQIEVLTNSTLKLLRRYNYGKEKIN